MRTQIKEAIAQLETDEDIKVLFAVESGSRAWGFASRDSDWDVRFVYIRRPAWYLSIVAGRDTIERMLPDDLDMAGWDLQKALLLFHKSNPSLIEWIKSPIVYWEQYGTMDRLRELAADYFSPKASMYHYLHMAERHYDDYLQGDSVKLKKYFYALRPILACRWIEQRGSSVPMEFEQLVEDQVSDPKLKQVIAELLERKMAGDELDRAEPIPVLQNFISSEIARLNGLDTHEFKAHDVQTLDQLFYQSLTEVWGLKLNA
ncbi:hypothetical protein BFP72_02460 [Reichenbachiella sp. 5M10]|uniref:nucleotidyltransferase domain-containing protein n=1 Tax=Reichenbachiella sp. 5M10 TaxID=1889772 RepID=UPI000C153238|nr:nucleotidyltransferase domain-containing protein [Reichenbachiella sp. 5M10]PIB34363.1 hypothetical protein BFP72_02460 [Reichenbachiella sp. 5M10]